MSNIPETSKLRTSFTFGPLSLPLPVVFVEKSGLIWVIGSGSRTFSLSLLHRQALWQSLQRSATELNYCGKLTVFTSGRTHAHGKESPTPFEIPPWAIQCLTEESFKCPRSPLLPLSLARFSILAIVR